MSVEISKFLNLRQHSLRSSSQQFWVSFFSSISFLFSSAPCSEHLSSDASGCLSLGIRSTQVAQQRLVVLSCCVLSMKCRVVDVATQCVHANISYLTYVSAVLLESVQLVVASLLTKVTHYLHIFLSFLGGFSVTDEEQEKCLMALWTGFSVQFWNRLLTLAETKVYSNNQSDHIF